MKNINKTIQLLKKLIEINKKIVISAEKIESILVKMENG